MHDISAIRRLTWQHASRRVLIAKMGPGSTNGRCVVLVVEDNSDIREMLCMFVEAESDCKAYAAEHGRQALDILATLPLPPCLILLDLMMPIMDGHEVIEALSAHNLYNDVIITIITATPDSSPKTRGGLLRKPFNPDELRKVLHSHCIPEAPTKLPKPP